LIKTYKFNLNEVEEKEGYNEIINYIINHFENYKSSYTVDLAEVIY